MSNVADTTVRTQRFNDAVRAFTPPSSTRHAKLMPLKDGIVELRQRGASLRLIRELLSTVDVAVGTDTIARFLADVNGARPQPRTARRTTRRPAAISAPASAAPPPSTHLREQSSETPAELPRTRGPRIADPRNL
ncbi:MAG: hypothetical protein M3128_04270 [Verrucomicrobiota bacterium]|nr:hypothetical protein [Verrucomicrobiota bacterium]